MEKRIHGFIMHPVKTRPYWWIRVWQPFYIKKGQGSVIYPVYGKTFHRSICPDGKIFGSGRFLLLEQCRRRHRNRRLLPDRTQQYGHRSHPDRQRGQYFTKRSPDRIRSQLSEYHSRHHRTRYHHFPYPHRRTYHHRTNVIVLPGITIGKHCFIGAGCVVTQNIPDYCVTVGNPARIIKRYNPQSQTWEKI